jgi:hypothetical protein
MTDLVIVCPPISTESLNSFLALNYLYTIAYHLYYTKNEINDRDAALEIPL